MYTNEDYICIARKIQEMQSNSNIAYQNNYANYKYPFFKKPPIEASDPFVNANEHFKFYGCNIGDFASFVPWIDNNISTFKISGNKIAVSFGFSGCYMAKYEIDEELYISHIQSGMGDCKHIWNDFCNRNRGRIKVHALFQPTNISDSIYRYKLSVQDQNNPCTIAGVITPDNKCYALVVNVATHLPLYLDKINTTYQYLIPSPIENWYVNTFINALEDYKTRRP